MDSPTFDRVADADRYEVISGGFDSHLFARAAIGSEDRVLDIGCGYGATTRLAARQASQGHAVGIDIAEPLLAQARAFAAAEGIRNVTYQTGDAQIHPFPEAGFDVAISRFGVMFFADPVAAFANVAAALQPGGRLVFTTLGPPEGNDLPRIIAAAVTEQPVAVLQSLADPERIDEVLTKAGFHDVTIDPVETSINLGTDAAAAAEFIVGWGGAGWPDTARDALVAAARPFETPGGVLLRSTAWLVSATVHP
ncbi:class I SAM-dependent methyltransferase [Amycolatopsis taiwanensis]|uniref:Methyltransferase n=1 Tax=Amycolatopsis taiwanensis TaxID=342230 RepID=A0A9W6QWX6_9PSEU|nr:methyltransferase domain-containing protein [Amycolatopsis taiwanensis]GLY65069.1 methyltransferase [Amycolatopsis taiwanensis]